MNTTPVFKEVLLVGGGHAHALLIRRWAMRPLPGLRLTLVSPEPLAPYSGMLPGLIAGHYQREEMHIDLVRLCRAAGVRLLLARAESIDLENRRLFISERPALPYELLSLDIGAVPDMSVPGVAEHAIPVKPIATFNQRWREQLETLRELNQPRQLAVVGGGAGSVEVALAMAYRLRKEQGADEDRTRIILVSGADTLLPGYPEAVRREVEAACRAVGLEWRTGFPVNRVSAEALLGPGGASIAADTVFWCTQAAAPDWPAASGLDCDPAGFVRVDETLRSLSHPEVFAAGDIASFGPQPLPKAGVYAVRQAPVLAANLRRALLAQPLRPFRPQRLFLSLLALGDRRAAGSRGRLALAGGWVWRWKDHIDRHFMRRFSELPVSMSDKRPVASVPPALIERADRREQLDPAQRCGGCGGKIGAGVLAEVLRDLLGDYRPEDACISQWSGGTLMQSVDQLRAPIDDPWLFGRIAVFHALNDLYAMNARPHSLLVAVALPFAGARVQRRELSRVLQGVASACAETGVELLGGHSAEGSELSLTLTVNGRPGSPTFSKQGLREGDILVLSKPLGSGLLLAGAMRGLTRGEDLATALRCMDSSQAREARLLARLGARACTDVSGFGLLGHLREMLGESSQGISLALDDLPLFPGALALAEAGLRSSLFPQNEAQLMEDARFADLTSSPLWPLLLDPQTAGGLLAALPRHQADSAREQGLAVIGQVSG